MDNRPKSRERSYSDKTTEVNKRENNYNASGRSKSTGRASLGGWVIIIIFILFFLFSRNTGQTTSFNVNSNNTDADYNEVDMKSVNTSVDEKARAKFTNLIGNGEDEVTIMIYMCGSDLETNYGMASSDINEIIYSKLSDKVNIVIETGGAKKWQNNVVSSKTNQRFLVSEKGLILLDGNVGRKSMTDSDTLSDFIKFASDEYPSDRYILIMWDHGGGTVSGYGYDEHFPNNTMQIDELSDALKKGGVKFDLIGFDTCLMATLETALAIEPYADYMIASEEIEPGTGWYYTNWISSLGENSSIPTIEYGEILLDDYYNHTSKNFKNSKLTLSLIDLAELSGTLPESFAKFAKNISKMVKNDDYKVIADARNETKEFSKAQKLDQVDLVDFAKNINTAESKNLAAIIKSAIKYNRSNISDAHGLSIYFPYASLHKMNRMVKIYENIEIDSDYSDAIKSYALLASGGQIVANNYSGNISLIDILLGNYNPTSTQGNVNEIFNILTNALVSGGDNSFEGILGGQDWINNVDINTIAQMVANKQFDSSKLEVIEKNGQKVLALSEENWALIHNIELNVFIDDGSGYIDLGYDNVFEFNSDGDLIVDFNKTWLALDDHVVAYYLTDYEEIDSGYRIEGYIPSYLNEQFVHIKVEFTSDNPEGKVLGASVVYDEVDTEAKGLIEIKQGDKIDFVCTYYSYDKSVKERYLLDTYIVDGDLKLSNINLSNPDIVYSYRLTDIYNNHYWLQPNRTN